MFGKPDREANTDSRETPSPESYRALIRPIRVKNHAKRRTLEEILENPPEFPTLTDPEKEAGEEQGERAAAARQAQ